MLGGRQVAAVCASGPAGLAVLTGLVAAHITLAWACQGAGAGRVRRRKLLAYSAAATVMIAKLTGRVGAA